MTRYRDAGKMVADVLATFTPLLQRASVDEAYLDITELVEKKIQTNMNDLTTKNLNNTFIVGCDIKDFLDNVIKNKEFCTNNFKLAIGGLIAEEIRHEVFTKTGYKCSAGIAHNKILAKLVCGLHKPNKQTILPQEAVENFFEITSINKVNSLGGKFGQTLSEDFQITFMGQLAKIPEKELIQKYDEKTGKWLFNIARGIDFEPVTTKLISKSIACCKKFQGKAALTTEESIKHWLHELAEEMIERLEKDLQENNRRAKQMVVSFSQENNKKDISSSRTQPLTLYNLKKIVQTAFDVIKKNCLKADGSYHLKFVGLSAGHFEDVSKVREITSFFQIGQNSKGYQKHKQKNECNEIKYLIKDENFDSTEAPNLIENVYYQLTQELQENPQDLVFYDDSCRIKNNNETVFDSKDFVNDFEKLADNANFEFQQNKYTDQLQKPSSSFFVKYFDDTEDFEEREKMLQIIEDEKDDFQETCEDVNEICPECKKSIPKSELLAHKDFHFALKLSRDEKLFENSTVKSIETLDGKKMHKSVKRKANSNNALLTFFIKNQKEDSLDLTEICLECNKKFRKEEINCHMDYHAAKRIHLEINATSSSTNCKKNPPKIKTKTTNKSVISFFKP
jgi:DNA polymerase eta